jgi:uncharacterized protein YjiS (DUF1127 family)
VHSPIRDIALSDFTEVAPLARVVGEPANFAARLRARLAAWGRRIRDRNELAQLTARDWAMGDYGINRWQAEALLRQPFWSK